MTAVTRLSLTEFRNYRDAVVDAVDGFVLLSGPNGAGKTNVLEAVSLLTPGRGLRQVPMAEMARSGGPGGFAVAARLGDQTEVGTGTTAAAPDRRQVRINGAPAAQCDKRIDGVFFCPCETLCNRTRRRIRFDLVIKGKTDLLRRDRFDEFLGNAGTDDSPVGDHQYL